jgi:hypothetical protein
MTFASLFAATKAAKRKTPQNCGAVLLVLTFQN